MSAGSKLQSIQKQDCNSNRVQWLLGSVRRERRWDEEMENTFGNKNLNLKKLGSLTNSPTHYALKCWASSSPDKVLLHRKPNFYYNWVLSMIRPTYKHVFEIWRIYPSSLISGNSLGSRVSVETKFKNYIHDLWASLQNSIIKVRKIWGHLFLIRMDAVKKITELLKMAKLTKIISMQTKSYCINN